VSLRGTAYPDVTRCEQWHHSDVVLEQLSIAGLRGFAAAQELTLAVPNDIDGSGLTVLVGPNGGGKSTTLEALQAAGRAHAPSFSMGRRNLETGDRVDIAWRTDRGEGGIRSSRSGSSQTERYGTVDTIPRLVHLPSRRSFNPYFSQNTLSRDQYGGGQALPNFRAQPIDQFAGRLFSIEEQGRREEFDDLIEEVVGRRLEWSIDQQDSGQYFLKIPRGRGSHSSDGLGEGTVSLFFLADALYDSEPGDVVVIDEPELSLHPIHQRRLATVLSRYAADRQIVVATHSPYLVSWPDLVRGGSIVRVHLNSTDQSTISPASRSSLDELAKLVTDIQNPHVLGLNASEIFFLEDGVILTEGQEDVVVYQALAAELEVDLRGEFFGWGVGGAEKMPTIVRFLKELGYHRVAGILDGNRAALAAELNSEFTDYRFFAIPVDDVRTKPARPATTAIEGLADRSGRILDEHRTTVLKLFDAVNLALAEPADHPSA
jgi:energy-coupling factor transporter ATP-binding protein EcfA2